VWKAHERGHLLERLQNTRLLSQAWEAWKKRLRHQRGLEGLSTGLLFLVLYRLTHWLVAAALAFAQHSQIRVTSSALRVWHQRLAMQQGAHAFAVQYANVQLKFRLLYKWRVQLRAHLKLFREAKIANKFFVMRRAWRRWVDMAEARGRENRLREWNKRRAGKLFAGKSRLSAEWPALWLRAFGSRRLEGESTEAAPTSACRTADSEACRYSRTLFSFCRWLSVLINLDSVC
jgi:protein SFI1